MDNEAYMNTGVNRSGLTPYGANTTTSPLGKARIGQKTQKKDMPAIVAAHNIPYVATACASYPFDLMNKVKKGREVKGPAYIQFLNVCPTGWGAAPNLTIKLGRLAVATGMFPLYEVEDGEYRLSIDREKLKPVEAYLKLQGRFRHLSQKEIDKIQHKIYEDYGKLKDKVAHSSTE
jgi:pyruvate ferredoxin oxidoreductase beta subunit